MSRRLSRESYLRWHFRNSHVSPKSIKPMDIPITSREEVRTSVARIAVNRGGDIAEAIRIYAEQINFTPESVAEIISFVEEQA